MFPAAIVRKGGFVVPLNKAGFAAFFVKGKQCRIIGIVKILFAVSLVGCKDGLARFYVIDVNLAVVRKENISVAVNIKVVTLIFYVGNSAFLQVVNAVFVAPQKKVSVIKILVRHGFGFMQNRGFVCGQIYSVKGIFAVRFLLNKGDKIVLYLKIVIGV